LTTRSLKKTITTITTFVEFILRRGQVNCPSSPKPNQKYFYVSITWAVERQHHIVSIFVYLYYNYSEL